MATKKKEAEEVVSTPALVSSVAVSPFTIVWNNVVYDFPDTSIRAIPADLYEYLATAGKVEAAESQPVLVAPPTDEVPQTEEA